MKLKTRIRLILKDQMPRAYLVLAGLFVVIGLVQCVRWQVSGLTALSVLVSFAPAAAFAAAYAATRRKWISAMPGIATAFCLLVLGHWGAVTLAIEALNSATAEVTDAGEYASVLDEYWSSNSDLVSHFPRPIPSEARDVRFSFQPGFLQGGTHVQLRFSVPEQEISDLYEHFAAIRTKSFHGGDWGEHANAKDGMPTTWFHTGDSQDRSFPADYEVMILDPLLTEQERATGSWNHGRSHGVAISRERGEIVYWAEDW